MAYSTITLTVASSAKAGSKVDVQIEIKNQHYIPMKFAAIGVLDSANRFIDWLTAEIPVGDTHLFSGSFIMPKNAVTVNAYSYYKDSQGKWRSDAATSREVEVEAAALAGIPTWVIVAVIAGIALIGYLAYKGKLPKLVAGRT